MTQGQTVVPLRACLLGRMVAPGLPLPNSQPGSFGEPRPRSNLWLSGADRALYLGRLLCPEQHVATEEEVVADMH